MPDQHSVAPASDGEALISVADYERAAARVMPAGAHSYLAGGATDEITLRDNQAAWQRLAIRPRMLVGVGTVTAACVCWDASGRTRS